MRLTNIRKTLSKVFLLTSALLMLATSAVQPTAHAIDPNQKKIFEDSIPYFNYKDEDVTSCSPDSGAGGGPAACAGLNGRDKTEQTYNFFVGKGFSPRASAAIVGNLMHESRLDPVIVNPTSGAFGVAQWLGSRRVDLEEFARSKNQDYKSFCLQLDFIWHEISEGKEKGQNVIGKMKDQEASMNGRSDDEVLRALTLTWENVYERANGAGLQPRFENAKEVFGLYGGGGGGSSGSASGASAGGAGCSASGGVVAGSVAETAIGLAWPQPFRDAQPKQPGRAGPLTPKPEYVQAMTQHNPQGQAQRPDGADCGIFVATVLKSSGADPEFPYVFTTAQYDYMKSHPEKYQEMPLPADVNGLTPGDILVVTAAQRGSGVGHIWIYVGPQAGGYYSASASLGDRSGNMGREEMQGFTRFQLK